MQISFKNFEAKTETVSANRIRAEVTSTIYVDLLKNGSPSLNVNYLFDGDTLTNEGRNWIDKCVEIGVKKKYTEEERKFVNDVFVLTLAVQAMAPDVKPMFRPSNALANFMNKGYPMITYFYENYEMGVDGVIKPFFMSIELTPDSQKVLLTCESMTQNEIKKFISYVSKHTYDTSYVTLRKKV